jgi:hypothetical protein
VRIVVIQAWNIGKALTTGMFKALKNLFVDFFQRLNAIS